MNLKYMKIMQGQHHQGVPCSVFWAVRQKNFGGKKKLKKLKHILFIMAAVLSLAACAAVETNLPEAAQEPPAEEPTQAPAQDDSPEAKPPTQSPKEAFLADLAASMSLEEKVGQMFFCSFEQDEAGSPLLALNDPTRQAIQDYHLGGVIYFASNIDTAEQVIAFSEELQDASKLPLFIATDEEGGRVSRITRSGNIDAIKIPPAKTIGHAGEPQNAYRVNEIIAKELRALGINTDFAPCADVDARDDGAIGDRSFSGDASVAAEFVAEAVRAYQENQVVSAVKHFPGHGAALGDTHEEAIVAEKSLEQILTEDMLPFKRSAEAGVPMIMVSHITVPEWGEPSSVSKNAMDYIRNELAYEGVIITDSFKMGAITNYYTPGEAAKKSITAGVDILLMPENMEEAIGAVLAAVKSGEIPEAQIDRSVARILALKYDYGLFERRKIDVKEALKLLDSKQYQQALKDIF